MKKVSLYFSICLMLGIGVVSCTKNDDVPIPQNIEIQDFVWKGMNSWYNWQSSVANLADTKDNNQDEYVSYLSGYADQETLFKSLLFDPGNTDRFSWFIEDYVEQNKSFQGVSVSTGIRRSAPIGIGNNQIIIYAQSVSLESPAYIAGVRRGDIINAIDGEIMNETNYASVINKLYSGETIVVSTAKEENGELTKLTDYTISPTEFSDNPVYLVKIFNDVNGKKVGYLAYNGFRATYNDELNAAFATLKTEGIDELILDLRTNGGGSVSTSAYLASMIYANAGTDKFADLKFNAKHTNQNDSYNFQNKLETYELLEDGNVINNGEEVINRLNTINRLYVLASGGTASASEMIINGLKPFMPVKIIGTTTYGKNVGSITLYDSPSSEYTSLSTASSTHVNAMQPIVFQIYNKSGESDYTQGFAPDIEVEEWRFWDNILPLGDENEVILKTALDDIRGLSTKSVKSFKHNNLKRFDLLELENKFEKEMYIDTSFFNK